MAITASNPAAVGTYPASTGQILAASESGKQAQTYFATVTLTGDGAASTATVNYIDGTQTLNAAPTAVLVSRIGGTAASTISVSGVAISGATSFTVNLSAAPANAATVICFVQVIV